MLTFEDMDVKASVEDFNNRFKKGGSSVLWFDKFLAKTMTMEHEEALSSGRIKYPREIKIPKPMSELLKGDFEPSRIIRLNEPLKFGDAPIWWNDSSKGVNLRVGYQNGDSRKPAKFSLNDKDIHGLLAGITGMGKSVTLNGIIFGMAFEYAPWEINLTLLDAKAADIKRFGNNPLPHISAIAATTDTDYILSVLEEKVKEMTLLQSVITLSGCGKIEDFRQMTGLCIPQNVIVTDEFQTLFKNAGKQLPRVLAIFDAFARLGRSTGYHLVMASQEIGGDIPKATLNQFGIRMCLGATADVSEQVLGNDDSKNIRTKGRLNVNLNPQGKSVTDNIEYKVPFQPSDGDNNQFTPQAAFLMKLGEQVNFIRTRSFYDENSVVYEEKYPEFLATYKGGNDILYLGEPSFVMREEEQVVKMKFARDDFENIAIVNQSVRHLERYCKMLRFNIEKKDCLNVALVADPGLESKIDLTSIADMIIDIRSVTDPSYTGVLLTVNGRKLMIEVDKLITKKSQYSEITDKVLLDGLPTGSNLYNRLNRDRAYYIDGLVRQDYINTLGFGGLNGTELDSAIDEFILDTISLYDRYGAGQSILTADMFPATYIWILGLQRIQGLGRDPKTTPLNDLKQILFDCCLVNVRFILTATNLDETAEVMKGVKYIIMDNATDALVTKIKATDYYPTIVPSQLGVLVNTTDKVAQKFKKMFFEGEL